METNPDFTVTSIRRYRDSIIELMKHGENTARLAEERIAVRNLLSLLTDSSLNMVTPSQIQSLIDW